MKLKILALVAVFLLGGCGGSSYQIKMPKNSDANVKLPSEFSALNLSNTINFDDKIFTLKYTFENTAEYYLPNEQGYEYSQMITVLFDTKMRDLSLYQKALEHTHKNENRVAPRHYEIKRVGDKVLQKVLFYPIANHANFNKYEANFILSSVEKCGLISVNYARNFDKNQNRANLIKMLNDGEAHFLKTAPKIECK